PALITPSLFPSSATSQIYTLSLHDALPIFAGFSLVSWAMPHYAAPITALILAIVLQAMRHLRVARWLGKPTGLFLVRAVPLIAADRKSTRLNSSHQISSYAVFCLKKKIATV